LLLDKNAPMGRLLAQRSSKVVCNLTKRNGKVPVRRLPIGRLVAMIEREKTLMLSSDIASSIVVGTHPARGSWKDDRV